MIQIQHVDIKVMMARIDELNEIISYVDNIHQMKPLCDELLSLLKIFAILEPETYWGMAKDFEIHLAGMTKLYS